MWSGTLKSTRTTSHTESSVFFLEEQHCAADVLIYLIYFDFHFEYLNIFLVQRFEAVRDEEADNWRKITVRSAQ